MECVCWVVICYLPAYLSVLSCLFTCLSFLKGVPVCQIACLSSECFRSLTAVFHGSLTVGGESEELKSRKSLSVFRKWLLGKTLIFFLHTGITKITSVFTCVCECPQVKSNKNPATTCERYTDCKSLGFYSPFNSIIMVLSLCQNLIFVSVRHLLLSFLVSSFSSSYHLCIFAFSFTLTYLQSAFCTPILPYLFLSTFCLYISFHSLTFISYLCF